MWDNSKQHVGGLIPCGPAGPAAVLLVSVTGALTPTTAIPAPIQFTVETYDPQQTFNESEFTALLTGDYVFSFTGGGTAATGSAPEIVPYQNALPLGVISTTTQPANTWSANFSLPLSLSQGDIVSFTIQPFVFTTVTQGSLNIVQTL